MPPILPLIPLLPYLYLMADGSCQTIIADIPRILDWPHLTMPPDGDTTRDMPHNALSHQT